MSVKPQAKLKKKILSTDTHSQPHHFIYSISSLKC